MKKNLKSLIAVIALCFVGTVNAQDIKGDNYEQKFKLGFGANAGYVFDDAFGLALGADVRLQYDLSQKTSLTLTTGFTNLFKEDATKDLGFIPVKAGFKGFIWEDRFYLLGEVGAGFSVTNDYDQTTLILAPGIGYATKYVDLSLRYEYYNDFVNAKGNEGMGQLALRLAYGFKL
ncbi:outer membrane beta-barrel protein [Flavobacterium tegetincola]|uniref:outer membrane beta-barrel protein n=1 Tax=Flavobacterium tegetincola TaxID=150172 RepID=UPI000402EAA7|nr:outer membrane beta-barrel protein [Flavobacterium tegetincola]